MGTRVRAAGKLEPGSPCLGKASHEGTSTDNSDRDVGAGRMAAKFFDYRPCEQGVIGRGYQYWPLKLWIIDKVQQGLGNGLAGLANLGTAVWRENSGDPIRSLRENDHLSDLRALEQSANRTSYHRRAADGD